MYKNTAKAAKRTMTIIEAPTDKPIISPKFFSSPSSSVTVVVIIVVAILVVVAFSVVVIVAVVVKSSVEVFSVMILLAPHI